MKRQKMKTWGLLVVTLTAFLANSACASVGMRTRFGEVYVKNLKIGMTYSLDKLINFPLRITNESDSALDINSTVIGVSTAEVKPGFEPIPNINWVKLSQQHFPSVQPMHEAVTDVIISIPNDKGLLGRKFEVDIWSRSSGAKGMFESALKSRLLLFIDSNPPSEAELKKKFVNRRLANMDFTLFPTGGVADNVPLGKDFNLSKGRHISIKIVNPNDEKLNFEIHSIANWQVLLPLPPGTIEAPNPGWVRSAKPIISIEPNSIKETPLIVNIPDKPENRGKAFFFVISVDILGQEIPTHVYYQLVAKTQK